MKPKADVKNFSYGEIWPSRGLTPKAGERRGKVLMNPEKFTTNVMFLKYLERYNYRLYIDFQATEAAYTNVTMREIVISGSYSDRMISNMLQHELGHLVLFDVNQFLSVRPDTIRSSIAKVLYTPAHLKAHGISKLLMVENIIQDIIIETLAEGECVCHGYYVLHGERLGVKHMDRLEDPSLIAKEVCDNLLKTQDAMPPGPPFSKALEELIDSMLEGLEADNADIEKAAEKLKNSRMENHTYRRMRETMKVRDKMDKMEKAIEKASTSARQQHLENIQEKLREKLDELESPARVAKDKKADADAKARELQKLQEKLDNNKELQALLEQEKADGQSSRGKGGKGDPSDGGEPGGEGEEAGAANGSEGTNEKSPEISRNLTDHLADDQAPPGGGHSYDCGFPHPLKKTRDELEQNRNFSLKQLSSELRRKRIKISSDDGDNMISNRIKSQDNEFTFFRSSKKEFGMEDMMKGKRRLRLAGVNVLIGLDISGSMSREWTTLFKELSVLVEDLQHSLDIENVVYFTYNQRLQQHSKKFDDLTLRASGGNAFGYVYPEIMEKLPLMQKNEIILVTDCGDNLGFKLNDSCLVERGGAPVENHISIIDTEGAAFYNTGSIDPDDWSLYRYGDRNLFDNIKLNIENLIDR